MTQSEESTVLCSVCKSPVGTTEAFLRVGRWTLPMCEVCGMAARVGLHSLARLREVAASRGVLFGVPFRSRE